MTRQEAKEKLLSDCKIIMHYSWSEDRQKQDVPHSYLSDIKTIKHIDKIYNDFENRSCENCKHWQGNIETPTKGICIQLGVHNIGGCGDYWEAKQ